MTARAAAISAFGALALAQALVCAASAQAQVAVLRVDPAAEALCAALESALTDAQLVPDPGYLTEARNQRLDPSADGTLEVLIPLLGLRLAVVPQSADDQSVQVEFRDGRTGESLGGAAIPLDGGLLGFVGRHTLRREVFRRLGTAPPQNAPAGGAMDEPPADDAIDEDASDASESHDSTLVVQLFAGLGIGTRELQWPANGELRHVETGMFAAYDLRASFAFSLGDSLSLGPELAYQSSLDHRIEETHVAGPAETIGIRAHRLAALLVAGVRLGDSGRFVIAPALGYGTRSLRPEVHHLLTPSYSLAGPIARLALRLGIGDSVGIELAPEAQWVLVGDELEDEGVEPTGFSFGGEALLSVELSTALALELGYREAHALLTALEGSATDVERFVTLRVRWMP